MNHLALAVGDEGDALLLQIHLARMGKLQNRALFGIQHRHLLPGGNTVIGGPSARVVEVGMGRRDLGLRIDHLKIENTDIEAAALRRAFRRGQRILIAEGKIISIGLAVQLRALRLVKVEDSTAVQKRAVFKDRARAYGEAVAEGIGERCRHAAVFIAGRRKGNDQILLIGIQCRIVGCRFLGLLRVRTRFTCCQRGEKHRQTKQKRHQKRAKCKKSCFFHDISFPNGRGRSLKNRFPKPYPYILYILYYALSSFFSLFLSFLSIKH